MKLIFMFILLIATPLSAQQGYIPSFPIEPSDIQLTRLAQPGTYFDKVGRKFAILGFESGTFEAWAYPLKLFRNFEFSFLIGSSTEPVKARDIVRYISVTPEGTTLTYTYQSFTIKATYITPIDQPGAFILLDVNTTEPLTIICSFLPVLQPMWPAGIGGQYAYWDNDLKAYLISEPTRSNHAYVGSPAAGGISYTPAHMLSDHPNQFTIKIDDPASTRGKLIPITMAGGKGKRDDIKQIYNSLAMNVEKLYRENVEHYSSLRTSTLRVETPDERINLAFEWAKVAYDNLVVDNPDLGKGLVAGLGASGTSGRPGFGWFFGGDAFINSFSLNSFGAYTTVKDALLFTQKWQREDGKMAHELSQAAGYIDWWKAYPYGYIHGDTSPFYLCAMYDYYRMTNDVEFVKNSWTSLRRAYEWSLSTDEDGDGLMDNKKAGLGALEYGPLTGVQSDIYTAAVWVRAAFAMQQLAIAAGEASFVKKAGAYYQKAAQSFNQKFWDEQEQQYSYAFDARGNHVRIVSPWSSVGLMWELGTPERSARSLERLNSAELSTDWGTRSISIKSEYFQPLNYNYGAVWPFLTSWVATAQYKHHLPLQGYGSLLASVNHTFDNALGNVTEVFSGYQNIWPQEAVAHQGFCTAGVVLPLVRGMLGLEGDAPGMSLTFAPQLPADWRSLGIDNLTVGTKTFGFSYTRESNRIILEVRSPSSEPYALTFAPALGIGTTVDRVRVNGEQRVFRLLQSSQTIQPVIEFVLADYATVEIEFTPTVELLPPYHEAKVGDTNRGLKIISTSWSEKTLRLVVEGLAGEGYELGLANGELVAAVSGAVQDGNTLLISFPPGDVGEFVRSEITITIQ